MRHLPTQHRVLPLRGSAPHSATIANLPAPNTAAPSLEEERGTARVSGDASVDS